MGRYLVRRVFISIISIFGLLTATFFLLRLLPGGPFDEDTQLAPQVLAILKSEYGLDKPLMQQYFQYVIKLFHFDLGKSVVNSGAPVSEVLLRALPRSFGLGISALILGIVAGFSGGFAYFATSSKIVLKIMHFIFLSAPTLFLGPLLILILGIWLNILPITVGNSWFTYTLPLLVLGIRPAANLSRLLIGGLEESLSQPWAITAKAYGFSNRRIVLKFAMKQSLIPVLSYLGNAVAAILSGSLFVEIIFNVDGLGSQFVQSLVNRDYSVTVALTLMFGLILIVSNLIFDILIFSLDARMEKN